MGVGLLLEPRGFRAFLVFCPYTPIQVGVVNLCQLANEKLELTCCVMAGPVCLLRSHRSSTSCIALFKTGAVRKQPLMHPNTYSLRF